MISGNELVIISTYFYLTEHRADNFIVGLTNVPPTVRAPTLWNYAVCGQYPGAVSLGATVTLQCTCKTFINYLYNI